MPSLRVTALVGTALVAFAGNSILCRAALARGHADPASFTLFRVAAGAATLVLLLRLRGAAVPRLGMDAMAGALALFAYAALFSWAYVRIGAGAGALVLFACVQATMIVAAVRAGAGPRGAQWAGIAVALVGLAVLTLPGTTAPDPVGLATMALAGVAWGLYTLRGRRAASPLSATAAAFLGAVPLAVATAVVAGAVEGLAFDATGALLSAVSGSLASGCGYAIWYAVLPSLDTTRAAVLQLAVPVLAAAMGVLLLGETASPRLALASAAILGGVALAARRGPARP